MTGPTLKRRSSGILLHPTSLPGPYGIGDLGPVAYQWIEALARSGQTWWQILPLGPTGYGDSPYQLFSAFAGNPLLISLERLADDGLLTQPELEKAPAFPVDEVNYGWVIQFKMPLLRLARVAVPWSLSWLVVGATPARRAGARSRHRLRRNRFRPGAAR